MADGKAGPPEGNKNAAKQRRLITDALRKVVTQSPDKIRAACEKLLDAAAEGDIHAFREISDRIDGKAIQAVDLSIPDNDEVTENSDIDVARKLAFALDQALKAKSSESSKDQALH